MLPAAVFRLHYQELMAKEEEIARLRAGVGGHGEGDSDLQLKQQQQQQQQDSASEDLQL